MRLSIDATLTGLAKGLLIEGGELTFEILCWELPVLGMMAFGCPSSPTPAIALALGPFLRTLSHTA